jgi:RNA recognition motif-containing protein
LIASQNLGDLRRAEESAKLPDELATQRQPCQNQHSRDYTTVMLRNLPNDYMRDMLIKLLEAKGFGARFDFVYLPVDFVKYSGLGYAFVNFISHQDAINAMNLLEGFDDWEVRSKKVLALSWSTPLQGLAANIERYRNSAVMHADVPQQLKPLVFEKGCPVAFPAPTRCIALGVGSKLAGSLGQGTMPPMQSRDPAQEDQAKTQLKRQVRNMACPEVEPGEYTTAMLRNVPNNYTRAMLVELLDMKGFRRKFDFVYVPTDFEKGSGLGYAFVNFVGHKDAQDAIRILEKFDDWKVPSRKILQLSWSMPLQGLIANIERYRNTSVMHPDVPEEFKPLVFKDGQPVCFPPPTRNIHPPQRRK